MKPFGFVLSIILSIICLQAIDLVQVFHLNYLETVRPHLALEACLYMLFFIPIFVLGKSKNIRNITSLSLAAICGALLFITFSIFNTQYLNLLPSLLGLIMTLFLPFLLWNHLNHFYSIKEAIKDYLMIPILFGILLSFGKLLSINFPQSTQASYLYLTGAILSLLSAIYFALMGTDEVREESISNTPERSNLLKLSCYLSLPLALQTFLFFIFKHKMKVLHGSPASYSSMMGIYSKICAISSLAVLAISLHFIFRYLKKYDAFSLISRAAIFLCIIVSFGFVFFSFPNKLTLPPIALTTATINCFTVFLAFPLIQLIYLSFPLKERTRAKIWTEVIFYKPIIMLPSLLIQGIIVISGSIALVPPFASGMALLLIISLFLMARGRMNPALV
jgi:hypothetical protein